MHPIDEAANPELTSLLDAATAHYDATAPRVYGAGIPGLGSLGGLDPKAFLIEFFARQVVGRVKDYAKANRDDLAKQVAEATRAAMEVIIDRGVLLLDAIDG
jgi:hypothetical protein